MAGNLEQEVRDICGQHGNDRLFLMDIARAVQERFGCVSDDAMDGIAVALGITRVEVESVVTFYSFLSKEPKGKVVIRLCNDVVDRLKGGDAVGEALSEALGVPFGGTTPDGRFTLEHTACIGMSDQAPAMLVNSVVVTDLTPDKARAVVAALKANPDPQALVTAYGDGNNAAMRAMVRNNIRESGPVCLAPFARGQAIRNAIVMTPEQVIGTVEAAGLRGRGGAGFPTALKWKFTRANPGEHRYILCNADEGEPGTFKDRVLLTETPDQMFEGMTVAAYAIGSDIGIVYLRAEYAYMKPFLDQVLASRRADGLLGKNICGKPGFDFDIRIQVGAGAYICGEETALISSCEGRRGDPMNRPPFPAQKGFRGLPSAVDNVETFCCAARVLEKGAGWFKGIGTKCSSGTKLLSISGDCDRPGVYELPFGVSLTELLEKVGATPGTVAVQVGGPSGQMVPPEQFGRVICFDDLATGGSIVVFGPGRDPLEIAHRYMQFFEHESCGYCVPCRVGNTLLRQGLAKILDGKGEPEDLAYLQELGETIKVMSRCGLGQTSANPVLTTLRNFKALYETRVRQRPDKLQPLFDIRAALADAEALQGRKSVMFTGGGEA